MLRAAGGTPAVHGQYKLSGTHSLSWQANKKIAAIPGGDFLSACQDRECIPDNLY